MSSLKIWNGSAWTLAYKKSIWNGSAWSNIFDISSWSGSSWISNALGTPLDTQIVSVGYDSGYIDYGFGGFSWSYSGYSSTGFYPYFTPFGSIADGTSNIYSGAEITQLCTDDTGNILTLEITGATNSGWTAMYVNNTGFSRADASFSSGIWTWAGIGNNIWTNPTTTVRFI